jgi:hypothetical protein
MPKELNLSTNERIDLEDFQYGTRTFTVDALRAHVSRIVSGGYRGGFVLEGFRVEIPNPLSENQVTVYNGIALDRAGHLITNEEGNLFLNNSKYSQTVKLLNSVPNNYLMVEYTLEPVDYDGRAFWDPTYENPPIVDSGNDNVPQPKGKEFTVSVPTRKAQSWTIIVSGTGFEDATDPNKIRIPIAIIPIDVGGTNNINLTLGTDTDFAQTTLIEQPVVGTVDTETLGYLRCADTRMFPDSGVIKLYDPSTNGVRPLSNVANNELTIVSNDRENNVLYVSSVAFINPTVSILLHPRVGDVVRVETTTAAGENLLLAGGAYDCRPMLFSFTDSLSATKELTSPWTSGGVSSADRLTEPRNNRYWAARSLITDPDTTGNTTKNYPADVSYGQHKSVPVLAPRVENRIKQEQDFFRVLGALLLEMKYGVPEDVVGAATETTLDSMASGTLYKLGIRTTAVDKFYLVDTTRHFSQSLVGSWVRCTDATVGANFEKREQIAEVIGDHVLKFTSAWPATWTATDTYVVEKNYPSYLSKSTQKGFVDAKYTGSLEEVYDGRVDQFTDSYAEDLNRRLSINKVATITVGDGINTHGDFTGDAGLLAAFKLAYDKKRGAHIHIRRGTYNVSSASPIAVGPNTTITGEGKGATIINLIGSDTQAGSTPNYFVIRDYYENYADAGATFDQILCSNISFKDLSIRSTNTAGNTFSSHNYGYPLISNVPLSFYTSPGVVDNTVNPGQGFWRPSGAFGTSPVENFKLENVELLGGGHGDYLRGTDVTYSVYLLTSEANNKWQFINTDITFKGCTFDTHRGGTAILKGCRKVLVDGCEFRNKAPVDGIADGGAYAPLEGITFASVANRDAVYYDNPNTVNSDGDVLITNCSFLGQLYETPGSATYPSFDRAWVTFTPSYKGQNVEISSCIFRGDLIGDAGTTSVVGPRASSSIYGHTGTAKRGVGVLNCSPFDIKVSDCNFHTLERGVKTQIGLMNVSGCNFWNMNIAVLMRPEIMVDINNYTRFGDVVSDQNFWNAENGYFGQSTITDEPATYTRLIASNNTFMYCANGVVVGLYPHIVSDYENQSKSSICIEGSYFEGCSSAINWDIAKNKLNYGAAYAGVHDNILNNWNDVQVSNCEFYLCTYASRVHGELKQIVNNHANVYSQIFSAIYRYKYVNNSHANCTYSGIAWNQDGQGTATAATYNAGSFTAIIGREVVFQGNTFSNITHGNGASVENVAHTYSVSPVVLLLTSVDTVVSDNVWKKCSVPADHIITQLKIGIFGSYYDDSIAGDYQWNNGLYKISNNSMTVRMSAGRGVCNGIYMGQVFPEVNSSQQCFVNTTGVARTTLNGCLSDGPHFRPQLEFINNSIDLTNANFGFMAVQHQNGAYTGTATGGDFGTTYGYSNFWEWHSADVKTNDIKIRLVTFSTQDGRRQYGNDIGCVLTNTPGYVYNATQAGIASETKRYAFLGACNSDQPENYVACMDLRRCTRADASTTPNARDLKRGSTINVIGNLFSITDENSVGVAPSTNSRNLQEKMGLRISKFSREINIKDNTFNRAPLLLKWSWNNPYMTTSVPNATNFYTGYTININANSFYNDNSPHTVDINPAVGFGHQGDATANTQAGFAQVSFTNNTVKAKEGASTNADWDLWEGGVRFWFPDRESWCQAGQTFALNRLWDLAGGFHVHQDYLKYKWSVNNNDLQDTYFRLTKAQDGGLTVTGAEVENTNNILAELCKNTAVVGNYSISLWQQNSLIISASTVLVSPDKVSLFGHNNNDSNYGKAAWTGAGADLTGSLTGSHIELVAHSACLNYAGTTDAKQRPVAGSGSLLGA